MHAFYLKPHLALRRPPPPHLRVFSCGSNSSDAARRSRETKPGRARSYDNPKRRRGRPAHKRTPFDSPLRDGNRDRLIGLLTKRSAVTLSYYLMETNINVHHWLLNYMKEHPIPARGSWEDVSGETFLRELLTGEIQSTKWSQMRDPMFDCVAPCGVDPRSIAQRIMTIRAELAKEFIEELQNISEENSSLYRETLHQSLLLSSSEEEDS